MTDDSASAARTPRNGHRSLPLLLLGGCVAWIGFDVVEAPVLRASGAVVQGDEDRDGLLDVQEEFLGTSPYLADSDGDGYSDAEELARQSDPTRALSTPDDAIASSVGLFALTDMESELIHVTSALYVEATPQGNPVVDYHLGFMHDGDPLVIPSDIVMRASAFRLTPISPGRMVIVINTPIPNAVLNLSGGNLNLFAATMAGTPSVDGLNITQIDGIPVEVDIITSPGSGEPSGLVYRPLVTTDNLPSTFESGKSCSQETADAGSSGASLFLEITNASCTSSDGSCNGAACAASVGSTVEVLDPATLIGG